MIDHLSFYDALAHLEQIDAEREWLETIAGVLVLRLFDHSRVNPAVARPQSDAATAARSTVMLLDRVSVVRARLARCLDALASTDRTTRHRRRIVNQLLAYGAVLAEKRLWALALDVYQTVRAAGYYEHRSHGRVPSWVRRAGEEALSA